MSDCFDQRRPPIEIQPHKHTSDNIRQIIVTAGGVVNRVPAGSSRPPLQPNQLSRQARIIEQLNPFRVQQRQQIAVQVGLRPGRLLERNPMLGKPSPRTLAGIAIADNPGDAKPPKNRSACGNSNLGIKRRPDSENRI
jgi:hypothetical protein